MTDPNDDLDSVADPGSMSPEAMTEDSDKDPATKQDEKGGVPGAAADSPAAQGAPVGPPD
ncbi:hypothetical protein OWR29_28870 [Actinoplanes sp. Pm04-4]|uniref:Uncharacterized protein n=1 Tax=Paractinoplanes pyxinae TaxID=2997416 RepID=A0ABT4B686_9ACTN|nr:hypothetical protein [Actinoplanes pyxinae]MCY1142025.1 hypothetical protein [Actinoplanes pyxinae]